LRTALDHRADELVAWNAAEAVVAGEEFKVGVADAGAVDADESFAFAGARTREPAQLHSAVPDPCRQHRASHADMMTPAAAGRYDDAMQRVCFVLQVKKDRLEEYKERHKQVWPEMLDALRRTGWHNYSLFLRDDGMLIGYVETPDFQAALDGMAREEVNARWQAEMREFFEDPAGRNADEQMRPLEEVFHLD
jgi:L-rhamnose mutarotase